MICLRIIVNYSIMKNSVEVERGDGFLARQVRVGYEKPR